MANPVKGAISQLGERVIDTSKGFFEAIRDAFGNEAADSVKAIKSEVQSLPSYHALHDQYLALVLRQTAKK